jgi:anthranilate phosphoribosyltransferase
MSDALKPVLAVLADGARPDGCELTGALGIVLRGEATASQIGALLMGLERIGIGTTEIAAGARAMRAAMVPLEVPYPTIDVCGTGGDGSHTLNISTAVSFVLAGCGLKVAKHGNRGMSSRSGAGDVLEALGVTLTADGQTLLEALDQAGLAFLFAQNHHPAMRHVAPVRRELGFRTLFNLLGPLSNPAGAARQLMGVYAPGRVEMQAQALRELGCEAAWVVCGAGGVDEVVLHGPTQVSALDRGQIQSFAVTPEDAGLPRAPLEALRGGDAAQNAAALQALLGGTAGAYRDAVLLNAAAALVATRYETSLTDGAARAAAAIDSGAARQALETLVQLSAG